MGKKILDLLTLICSQISLPRKPFPISNLLELFQSPSALSVPVLCSRCGAQPLHSNVGNKRGIPWFVPLLKSHWKELGLLQFSVFCLIPGAAGFYPKRVQSTEVAEVRCWDLGWKGGNHSVPFLSTTENSSAVHPGHLDTPRNPPQPLPD